MGYILPHKFFNANYGMPLRKMIAEGKNLYRVVHFGDQQVFENATTYTCLLFLSKKSNKKFLYENINNLTEFKNNLNQEINNWVDFSFVTSDEWIFISGEEGELFYKLKNMPIKLLDYANIFQGIITGADKIYITPIIKKTDNLSKVKSKELDLEIQLENEILRPLLKGKDIKRYEYPINENVVIYPYKNTENDDTNFSIIPLTYKELKEYPLCFDYLKSNKQRLIKRSQIEKSNWWKYGRNQNLNLMPRPKIIYQVLSKKGAFTLDENADFYFVGAGGSNGHGITVENDDINKLKYLLGILNSKLTTFFISKVGSNFRGGFYSFGKHSFEKFPLPSEKLENEELEALVDKMINLNKELSKAAVPRDKKLLKKQIETTDYQINQLVYQLYGLTDDEIKIIEDNV